jgi:hypothetical protein
MTVMKRPLCLEFAVQTDVGRKPSDNEDNFAIVTEYALCAVADGLGAPPSVNSRLEWRRGEHGPVVVPGNPTRAPSCSAFSFRSTTKITCHPGRSHSLRRPSWPRSWLGFAWAPKAAQPPRRATAPRPSPPAPAKSRPLRARATLPMPTGVWPARARLSRPRSHRAGQPGAAKAAATAAPPAAPAAPGAPPQTHRAQPGGCCACAVGSSAAAPLGVGVAPNLAAPDPSTPC